MDANKLRSTAFFSQYVALLLFALVWVQLGYVRERVGDKLNLFYLLDSLALCYVGLRAYLALGRRVSYTFGPWRPLRYNLVRAER